MPKINKKGYAQKVISTTGKGEGYAQLKGRAMPKM